MPDSSRISEQWLALSQEQLTDRVRRAVRTTGAQAAGTWAAVAANPVLAAKVRGVLAGLQAQMAGSRDEAMWTAWIAHAKSQLRTLKPVDGKPADGKPVAAKPAGGKPVGYKAAAGNGLAPNAVTHGGDTEVATGVAEEVVLTPVAAPAAAARPRPAVAPLVFRAPGS